MAARGGSLSRNSSKNIHLLGVLWGIHREGASSFGHCFHHSMLREVDKSKLKKYKVFSIRKILKDLHLPITHSPNKD